MCQWEATGENSRNLSNVKIQMTNVKNLWASCHPVVILREISIAKRFAREGLPIRHRASQNGACLCGKIKLSIQARGKITTGCSKIIVANTL